MSVTTITTTTDYDEAIRDGIVVIDFWAQWCGPCRSYAPAFLEAAEENPQARFVKLNVDEAPELAARHNIKSIPTTLIMKDGVVVERLVGVVPARILSETVKNLG